MMIGKRMIRIRATVQDGGQIAIDVPTAPAGAHVEVLLILPDGEETSRSTYQQVEAPVARPSQSADDVELFLEAERAAWEH